MIRIEENTFAAACYDQNSVKELRAMENGPADAQDCATWGISPQEWSEQVSLALAAKLEG